MPFTTPEIISTAALGLAIVSFLWQRFGIITEIKKDQSNMELSFERQIAQHKTSVAELMTNHTNILTVQVTTLTQLTSQMAVITSQANNLSTQLSGVDNRISKQEMKMDLFWGAVQETVKDMIKQPIHFRKDELLDKFPNLGSEEIHELKDTLQLEKREMLSKIKLLEPEKKAYLLAIALMLARIDSVLIDRGDKCLI
jgi:hypothetical protein